MTQVFDVLLDELGGLLVARSMMLTLAESCTGGLAAARLTSRPGSSAWFDRGFVAYSHAAKSDMLAVPKAVLVEHGSVSEHVVGAMSVGAVRASRAHVAIAMSGIAGPGGGTTEKPVGMVCLGWYLGPAQIFTDTRYFAGDRDAIREQTVRAGFEGLHQRLSQTPA
ncbi:MAG: damage-inducible protein CinA [Thiotrichales bacterium]|nr:damage-inducible protein CinA [Thiotrichales bacterium]